MPRGFPLGCKRPVIDTGYFEAFNRDNVSLVDLRRGGIEEVTPTGIRTAQGFVELDVIVFATGFDAMTGALDRIDIRGSEGRRLRDEWADGPRTYLGLQVAGFPNLFSMVGPGAPSVLATFPPHIEQQVNWIGDLLGHMDGAGCRIVEEEPAAQDAWVAHVNQVAEGTMFTAPTCNSWYNGQNIPGKPRVFTPYVGGFNNYADRCDAAAAAGYEGFVIR
jgi:cyclohexanone monooxygenase